MSFTILYSKKKPFYGVKTRRLKGRKSDIFPNRLTHGFGPKWPFFQRFFFQAIQARKMSFTIFQSEKTPFEGIKTRTLKSRKIDIFQKRLTYGFGPKWPFFKLFFLRQYRPGKCLLRYSRAKNAFLGYKGRSSKSRKIHIFGKGLTHDFFPKWPFFILFFLGNIGQENVFYDILKRKTPFQAIREEVQKVEKFTFLERG